MEAPIQARATRKRSDVLPDFYGKLSAASDDSTGLGQLTWNASCLTRARLHLGVFLILLSRGGDQFVHKIPAIACVEIVPAIWCATSYGD